MSLRCSRAWCWVALLGSATACGPPIDPAWLITGPRELALEVALTAQGPYGERVEPGPRSFRDALPLDTLSLNPVVVDADGRLDGDELEGLWVLCSGIGSCLLRRPLDQLGPCADDEIQPSEPCTFDDGGEGTLTVPDLPPELPDNSTVFALISGPTVGWLGSPPDGPGLDDCIARLNAAEHLEGCLMMERALSLGPLGDLVESLEAVGLDPGIEHEAESLLARPRNRNPAVERLLVTYGSEAIEIEAGARVSVPRDAEITIGLVTTEDDDDSYDALVGDEMVTFSEELGSQWWFDRPLDRLETLPRQTSTRVQAGAVTGTVRVHAVVRDNLGGEGWGFIDLDFGG